MTRLALLPLALVLAATAAAAQSPSPEADLASMTAKAAGDPYLAEILRQFGQSPAGERNRMMLREIMVQFPAARDGSFTKPIHYAVANAVMAAQRRAQLYGQILASDLDNDGQITRQEVRDTLEITPGRGAAEAFFTSDANDNSVLETRRNPRRRRASDRYRRRRPWRAQQPAAALRLR